MLKLLACLLMLIDHIGLYFSDLLPADVVLIMRAIGRLAFPIFAWQVARGFDRTRNLLFYFIRMSVFAVLSELIIRFSHRMIGLSLNGTNVLVTFSLALVVLSGYRLAMHSFHDMIASLRPISPTAHTMPTATRFDVRINLGGITLEPRIGLLIGTIMIISAVAAAIWLKPDYNLYGLASVLLFYVIQDTVAEEDQQRRSIQAFTILNIVFVPIRIFWNHFQPEWAVLQCLSVLGLPLCYRFDVNKRPGRAIQYFFYAFYPLHIFLLCLLHYLLSK